MIFHLIPILFLIIHYIKWSLDEYFSQITENQLKIVEFSLFIEVLFMII